MVYTPRSRRGTGSVFVLVVALTGGQIAIAAPPTGGQIERQFAPSPEPKSRPLPLPQSEEAPRQSFDPGGVRFLLRSVDLVGATRFATDDLLPVFAGQIGKEVSLAELAAAAYQITVRYRNAGYLLSQAIVPAQTIENGRVRVEVVEGFVEGFVLRGTSEDESPGVVDMARQIVARRPIDTATLERYLLLMNDMGGASVRGTLLPSPTTTGAATLFLDVAPHPFSGGLSLDNRGGRLLGPWRTHADVQGHGLFREHDRTGLRWISSLDSVTWDRKLQVLQLSHDQPLGTEGTRLAGSATAVRSAPREQFVVALNQETSSDSYALTLQQPIRRSRSDNLTARGSLAAHNGKTTIFGLTESQDRLRSARVGLTWDAADALAGVNLVDVEYSTGFSRYGASKNGDPLLSRAGGRVDYRKLTYYLARVQTLAPRWSALVAGSGQRAMTDLLSSELFSFGGEQFGRGFDPSEMVGDHGVAGKAELRYGMRRPVEWLDAWSLYGFLDVGTIEQRSPLPGADPRAHARAAGAGSRFDFGNSLSAFVELARPMGRDVAAEQDRNPRVYAGLSARF